MDSVGQDTELKHLVWSMGERPEKTSVGDPGRLGATSAWGKGWSSHELKAGIEHKREVRATEGEERTNRR